ncbi:MAG: sigma-54 dependent transcriptional regulator [Deltaproteobacteria bacterium]
METTDAKPTVLIVDDEKASTDLLRIGLSHLYPVLTANDGATALSVLAAHPEITVAIIDQRMPGMTGAELIAATAEPYPDLIRVILTGYTDLESLISSINAGSVYRYITKPWNADELRGVVAAGMELHAIRAENAGLTKQLRAVNADLRDQNVELRREAQGRWRFDGILGSSPALAKTLALVEKVIRTDDSVLVQGPTGSGKELVARAIHYNGRRADGPFVSENCGALSPELLASELFGHRKGAFTGATADRKGLFQTAHGGTLFLDEIGECPPDLQVKLLRVLDQGEIRPIGDDTPIKVDVRIVAATHRDLEEEIAAGNFRADLYYRLAVFIVPVPSLAERREDIALLAEHFLAAAAAENGRDLPGFTAEALALLAAYSFPGNIRELQNEVRRASALAEDGCFVTHDLLSERVQGSRPAVGSELAAASDGTLKGAMEQFESGLLRDALARNEGNQTKTAADLGVSRRTLVERIQRYGLR